MIKKVTASFFILLTLSNIVILAHTFIPHHYHKSEVCINNSQCQIHSKGHKHDTADHTHEHSTADHTHEHSTTDHNHEHGGEYCISDRVFVIRSNRTKPEYKCLDFVDNRISLDQYQANLADHGLLSSVRLYLNNTQSNLILLSHCQYFGSAPGLRAPPIV